MALKLLDEISPLRALTSMSAVFAVGLGFSTVHLRAVVPARHESPTFTKDVAPILYRNCTTCHRPGGLGPFSLLDYEGARTHAPEMRDAVSSEFMPPWHADAPHGTFLNDRRLSEAEKQTITQWIDAGTPMGDAKDLPPAPVYPTRWTIGTPDAVVTMPTAFTVPAQGTIEYQYFEVPTNFTEDRWVQSIEILPGARAAVHHVLVYARVPQPAVPAAPPAAAAGGAAPAAPLPLLIRNPDHALPEPPPGPDGKKEPDRPLGALIGSTAPGTNVLTFPPGTALRVRAGSVLTFQMHYTAHGHEDKDRTSVGFMFAKSRPDEQMLAASFANGSFTIPAGAANYRVPAEVGFREAVKVWALLPHTHVRGVRWEYRLVLPDGTSEIVLSVPKYDFNWQTYYQFAKPLEIPAGGRLESIAWYDNTPAKKTNPDPTKDVKWGDQTWEEMQYTGFLYTVNSRRLSGGPPK